MQRNCPCSDWGRKAWVIFSLSLFGLCALVTAIVLAVLLSAKESSLSSMPFSIYCIGENKCPFIEFDIKQKYGWNIKTTENLDSVPNSRKTIVLCESVSDCAKLADEKGNRIAFTFKDSSWYHKLDDKSEFDKIDFPLQAQFPLIKTLSLKTASESQVDQFVRNSPKSKFIIKSNGGKGSDGQEFVNESDQAKNAELLKQKLGSDAVVQPFFEEEKSIVEGNMFLKGGKVKGLYLPIAKDGLKAGVYGQEFQMKLLKPGNQDYDRFYAWAEAFAKKFPDLEGIIEFEWILFDDGTAYLLECNPRLSASARTVSKDGINGFVRELVVPYVIEAVNSKFDRNEKFTTHYPCCNLDPIKKLAEL